MDESVREQTPTDKVSDKDIQTERDQISRLLGKAVFEVGGEDELARLKEKHGAESDKGQLGLLEELRVRVGTLLKVDTVSFLLGAGASKECGGPLIGKVPLEIERALLEDGLSDDASSVPDWLRCFYVAIRRLIEREPGAVPLTPEEMRRRYRALVASEGSPNPWPVNFEVLLSLLHSWCTAMAKGSVTSEHMCLDDQPAVRVSFQGVQECLRKATTELAKLCQLKLTSADSEYATHSHFLRKVLTRPLNLKRANIFTLNYDTLVEQAADAEGIVLIDGFVGTLQRVFRPESYDHDLYFPAETTEGHVHRLDRVLHLYKLHGSITWVSERPTWNNPYGVTAVRERAADNQTVVVYPTPAKWGETLGMPYAELLRRFAVTIVRPQSVLFVIGYGFGDEHINAVIRQAFAIPSFTLIVVDPNPTSPFVEQLRARKDRRVWIFAENFGLFREFVRYVLPDLRDESIRRKAMDTYRVLGLENSISSPLEGGTDA